jgi:hypothetical protein
VLVGEGAVVDDGAEVGVRVGLVAVGDGGEVGAGDGVGVVVESGVADGRRVAVACRGLS